MVGTCKLTRTLTVQADEGLPNDLIGDLLSSIEAWGTDLKWSPDGKMLALRSDDGIVKVVEPQDGKLNFTAYSKSAPQNTYASEFTWSPNGHVRAVTGGQFVQLWDALSGQRLRSLPASLPPAPAALVHIHERFCLRCSWWSAPK